VAAVGKPNLLTPSDDDLALLRSAQHARHPLGDRFALRPHALRTPLTERRGGVYIGQALVGMSHALNRVADSFASQKGGKN
jgi:hypothetical protein